MTRAMPDPVAAAFDQMPARAARTALALRDLVLEVAHSAGIDPLEETLKWGEPAYLPGRSGTTVRIGWDRKSGHCRLMVNCRTTLVDDWRAMLGDRLVFEGQRAIVVDPGVPFDREALALCVAMALRYHADKRAAADG